ncbi:hypothetical protein M0813_15768 [Anaeramoeba flamelloides]|uniref:Uncharacterized protein n=1 Tax=Anaeramoeba flamelloides TaxID=1746091 RepID=A0ABQ8Z2D7_9EUKA|nr:hypothetical protein M0813_15768 [Anaeramoeba flamelloides]
MSKRKKIFWIDPKFESTSEMNKIISPINSSFVIKTFCLGTEVYYNLLKNKERIALLIISSQCFQKDPKIYEKFQKKFNNLKVYVVNLQKDKNKNKKKKKNKFKKSEILGKKALIKKLEKQFDVSIKKNEKGNDHEPQQNKNNYNNNYHNKHNPNINKSQYFNNKVNHSNNNNGKIPICLSWTKNKREKIINSTFFKTKSCENFEELKQNLNKKRRRIFCVVINEKKLHTHSQELFQVYNTCLDNNIKIYIVKKKQNYNKDDYTFKWKKIVIKKKYPKQIIQSLEKRVRVIGEKNDFGVIEQEKKNKRKIVFWLNRDTRAIAKEKAHLEKQGFKVRVFQKIEKLKEELDQRKKKRNEKEDLRCIITSNYYIQNGIVDTLKNIYQKHCIVWSITARTENSVRRKCFDLGADYVPSNRVELTNNLKKIHKDEKNKTFSKNGRTYKHNPNYNDRNKPNSYQKNKNNNKNYGYHNNMTNHHQFSQKNNWGKGSKKFYTNNNVENFHDNIYGHPGYTGLYNNQTDYFNQTRNNTPHLAHPSIYTRQQPNYNNNNIYFQNHNISRNFSQQQTQFNCLWFSSDFKSDYLTINQLRNQGINTLKYQNLNEYYSITKHQEIKFIITSGKFLFDEDLIRDIAPTVKGGEFPPLVVYSRTIPTKQDAINKCQLAGANYIANVNGSLPKIIDAIRLGKKSKTFSQVLYDKNSQCDYFRFPKLGKQILLIKRDPIDNSLILSLNKKKILIRKVTNYLSARRFLDFYYKTTQKICIFIDYQIYIQDDDYKKFLNYKPFILCSCLNMKKKNMPKYTDGLKFIMNESHIIQKVIRFYKP